MLRPRCYALLKWTNSAFLLQYSNAIGNDVMTAYSQKRGIAGTVRDGACRDLRRILEVKYPIFSHGRFMVTGKDRVELDGLHVPVAISDVQIRPGTLCFATIRGVSLFPLIEPARC